MITTQEPDFAGIARKLAQKAFPAEKHPDLLNRNVGFYHAEIKHLRSDWETIRLLREARSFVRRDGDNDRGLSHRIDAHLSTLEAQFQ